MPCPYPDCPGQVGADEAYCGTCGRALDPAAVTAWLSNSAGTFTPPGAATADPTALLPPVPAAILPPPPTAPVPLADWLSEGQTQYMPPAAPYGPPPQAMEPPAPPVSPVRRAPTPVTNWLLVGVAIVAGLFALLVLVGAFGALVYFRMGSGPVAPPTLVVVVPATKEAQQIVSPEARATDTVPAGGAPPRIALAEFKARYDDPNQTMLILDVRTAAAYKEGHIKGAISFPEGEVDDRDRVAGLPQEGLIVAYCQ